MIKGRAPNKRYRNLKYTSDSYIALKQEKQTDN